MKRNTLAAANSCVVDKIQKGLLDKRIREIVRTQPGFARLVKILLAVGGHQVVPPFGIEEDLEILTGKRPRTWVEPKIRMMKGEACGCHRNSAACWHENEDKLLICTGYALSTDGLWRQHSWCWWESKDTVVETTTRRVAYFGFVMDDDEADRFYYNNCV